MATFDSIKVKILLSLELDKVLEKTENAGGRCKDSVL